MLRTLLHTLRSGKGKRKDKQRARERQRPLSKTSCWRRRLMLEQLEDRTLLSINVLGVPTWQEQGPGPIFSASEINTVTPQDTAIGAINGVVAEPTPSAGPGTYIVYAATVNGGVWRSDNITDAMFNGPGNPLDITWRPLTDNEPTLATSSLALDPLDQNGNTLWVGTGSLSSNAGLGGQAVGLLKTTDGGNTWTVLGNAQLANNVIMRVIPTGHIDAIGGGENIIVASLGTGIWWSDDGGQIFQQGTIAGTNTPLTGNATDLAADPLNPGSYYAALPGQGVYWSGNYGQTWILITPSNSTFSNTSNMRIAVDGSASPSILWVLTMDTNGNVSGLFRGEIASLGNITPPNITFTQEGPPSGLSIHNLFAGATATLGQLALTVDPADPSRETAFVSAQGQSGGSPEPSAIYVVFNGLWIPEADNDNGQPHPDSRSLTMLNPSTLLETDDGGIYGLYLPNTTPDQWISLVGNLRVTEFFSVGYDPNQDLLVGGAQDNGTPQQQFGASPLVWNAIAGGAGDGDGGAVAVDYNHAGASLLYFYADGRLESAFQGSASDVFLASPSSPIIPVSGLDPTDQVKYLSQLGTDNFYPITVDPYPLGSPMPLMFGMSHLYESFDEGSTAIDVSPAGSTGNVQTMAWGAENDPLGAAYYSTNTGQLWVRTTNDTGGQFVPVPLTDLTGTGPAGANINKIIISQFDYHTAFLLDSKFNVWQLTLQFNQTVNGIFYPVLPTWQEISGKPNTPGSLSQIATIVPARDASGNPLNPFENLQSLDIYDPTPGVTVVLVGGLGGVYRGIESGGAYSWSLYGAGLANALVTDLHYIPNIPGKPYGDVLVAGTQGRGAWIIPNASLTLAESANLEIDANAGDTIRLALDAANTSLLDVQETDSSGILTDSLAVPLAAISGITVDGTAGNVTLDVDENPGVQAGAGPIVIPNPADPNCALEFNGVSSDTFLVDDSQDQSTENITLGTDQITGLGMTMCYIPLLLNTEVPGNLQLDAGSVLSSITFDNLDPAVTTAISTVFRDAVTVQATAGPLTVNSNGRNLVKVQSTTAPVTINCGGLDTINVGDSSNRLDGIQGALTVNGQPGGKTTLVLDDQGTTTNQVYELSATTLQRLTQSNNNYVPNIGLITYSNLANLALHAGSGSTNTLFIYSTSAGTTTDVYGGSDNGQATSTVDEFVVAGGTAGVTLDAILGALNLHGQTASPGGESYVLLNDSLTSGKQTYKLTAGSTPNSGAVGRTGIAPITFDGLILDELFASENTSAVINVQSNAANMDTVIAAEPSDQVNVGSLAPALGGTMASVQGTVEVTGPGPATLTVDDSGDKSAKIVATGQVSGNLYSITGLSQGTIEYTSGSVQAVSIYAPNTGVESDTDVNGTPTGTALTVHAGFGNITVIEVPNIGGPLTVALGEDNTTYWFDGPATDNKRVYTINSTSVTRSGGFVTNIVYPTGFASESFALYTENANTDTINVQSSLPHTGWFLDGSAFNPNFFNIGDPAQGLSTVQGEIHVNPESESLTSDAETVNLNDGPNKNPQTFTFSYDPNQNLNNVSWNGGGFLAYNNTPPPLGNLVINAGIGNTTFQVKTLPAVNTAITLKGGSGSNTLNYSQYVGNVTVDMPEGTATGFTGGISNIHTVIGGPGNDTFYVPSAAAGTTTSITGGTGQNRYFVGNDGTAAGQVRNNIGAVVLTGAGTSNTLTVDDSGNITTTDTVSLTPTSVSGSSFFGSGGSLTYTGIGSVILDTSNASRIVRTLFGTQIFGDAITVEPQSNMVFTINGNSPPAGSHPGDSLTVNTTLVGTVTAHPSPTIAGSGTFTTSNGSTVVNYSSIETLAPVGWLVAAPDAGPRPEVKVYNAQTGALRFDLTAFVPSFRGGVRVAVGDVNGDGIPDIIAAQGPGDGSRGDSLVHVYDGISGQQLAGPLGLFDPFPGFHGGLYVAAADLTGSGFADIIVGQDVGGQGRVKVYSGQDGGLLAQFQPYGSSFTGSVRLAAGPVTSNGDVDVVTGAGPGGPPSVDVFDGPSLLQGSDTPAASFNAFDPSFTGGVYVATGLIHGQGKPPASIIVGEGAGGEPRVSVFDGTGTQVQSFLAFAPGFKGGVRVAAADVTGSGRSDIIAAEGSGHGSKPEVRAFDGVSLQQIDSFFALPANVRDGLFVAGGGKWGLFNPANVGSDPPTIEDNSVATSGGVGVIELGSSGASVLTSDSVAGSIVLPPRMVSQLANASAYPLPQGADAVFARGVEPWSVRAVDFLLPAMGAKHEDENQAVLTS